MIEFVDGGGVFSAEAIRDFSEMRPGPVPRDIQLIALAVISNGPDYEPFWYIRNGHHRAVSILLGGQGSPVAGRIRS